MCAVWNSRSAAKPPPQSMLTPPYHPEFGYLFPSAVVRRRLRAAMIFAGIGVLIGAIVVLPPVSRRYGDDRENELTETASRTVHARIAGAAELESEAGPDVAQDGGIPGLWNSCKNSADLFFNPKCLPVRKHKVRTSRLTAPRLATIEIGHVRSAAAIGQTVSAGAGDGSNQVDGDPSKLGSELRVPSTGEAARRSVSAMKYARNVRAHARSRDSKGGSFEAFAYAFPNSQYAPPREAYGSGHEAFKSSWRSSRSWAGSWHSDGVPNPSRTTVSPNHPPR